jgi:hypothetical protein
MSSQKFYQAKNKSKVRLSFKVEGLKGLMILDAGASSGKLSEEQVAALRESYTQDQLDAYLEIGEAAADAPEAVGQGDPKAAKEAAPETATNEEAQELVASGQAEPGPSVDVEVGKRGKGKKSK